MLYTTLNMKINKFIQNNPDDYGSQTVIALAQEANRDVHGYLSCRSPHQLGTLRKIIPNAFPKAMRDVPLVGNCNKDGVWNIMPMTSRSKGIIL